ncbi:MAG: pyruvate, phosphate dikinase, partial [Rhodobacteraceae bacterium]|nr:pyruvate, phosphate dikinase [Paracoccaceae bacterium]
MPFREITPEADLPRLRYGARARRLHRLVVQGLPVPQAVALSIPAVREMANGQMPDLDRLLAHFGARPVVSVRSSPVEPDWGGPGTLLNVGLNDEIHARLSNDIGADAATMLYLRFIRTYGVAVARLDPEAFDPTRNIAPAEALEAARAIWRAEMEEEFPQCPAVQLGQVLRSMARAWEGTSARLLRQARGAPADAGLGLIVQRMAFGYGSGECGAGVIQFVSSETGEPQVTGRYLSQAQGRDAVSGRREAAYLRRDPRGASLEEVCPEAFHALIEQGAIVRRGCGDELSFEFTVEDGRVWLLDAAPARRGARAAVRIAVDLARDGAIAREDALMRVEPRMLSALLHRQVRAGARRDVFARGIAASPGAARGRIVFTAAAAQAAEARDEASILVRHETTPEDIRGMHAAVAVLTGRGGMTSHAAVIARGLGRPCVVGASDLHINPRDRTIATRTGRIFREGEIITIDGTAGEALAGEAEMEEASVDGAFSTLLDWADDARRLSVRCNADTPRDAQVALDFGAEGIGLCRTEHMFFEPARLTVMHEMIFADSAEDRRAALERLLPMQRDDFIALFRIMAGRPVCIRLFDLPRHEFLPHGREAMRDVAEALDLPLSRVIARAEELAEVNPMLGMRGVRLGIALPEIYEMQARAIFEATVAVGRVGAAGGPEVMIPMVSARREVDLVRGAIEGAAAAVQAETGRAFDYRLGVMVETPRAALRAGEIASACAFLSFGTNDLTQMTYGLSRDDAGRFMSSYVKLGVYE